MQIMYLKPQRPKSLLTRRTITIFAIVTCSVLLVIALVYNGGKSAKENPVISNQVRYLMQKQYLKYRDVSTYQIGLIADRDSASRVSDSKGNNKWTSVLKTGKLTREVDGTYSVEWGTDFKLKGKLNEGGRGLELSELINWDGMLLAPDDRSGIVYEILDRNAAAEKANVVPRFILPTGNGNMQKGCKVEWALVFNNQLWLGSIGKEWTDPKGKVISDAPLWVKIIDRHEAKTEHRDFSHVYQLMRKKVGVEYPGYMIFEAGTFWHAKQKFVFAPRKVSTEPYDADKDERRGSNLFLIVDPYDYTNIETKTIGQKIPERGISSIKFIPFRDEEVVVLKTMELSNPETIETYMAVYNIVTGKVLMEETLVGKEKFEGVEFL